MGQQHTKENHQRKSDLALKKLLGKSSSRRDDESFKEPRPGSLNLDNLTDSGRELLVQSLEVQKDGQDNEAEETDESDVVELNLSTEVQDTLREIKDRPENQQCADCSEPSSTWASTTFGVFLCLHCVGAHRSLGSNVSFTQSTTIDASGWTDLKIQKLSDMGNLKSNQLLEYHVPALWPKPEINTPGSYRRDYIRAKYKELQFTEEKNPGLPPLAPHFWHERTTMLARAQSVRVEGKIEFVGIVSVTVVRAENLPPVSGAIPVPQAPFYTNPYCVVQLGSHSAKTRTINRQLNPVWNEGPMENVSFNMSWDGKTDMKVEVWNNDKIGKDRIIGSAVVDISAIANCKGKTDAHEVWVRLFYYRNPGSVLATRRGSKGKLRGSSDTLPTTGLTTTPAHSSPTHHRSGSGPSTFNSPVLNRIDHSFTDTEVDHVHHFRNLTTSALLDNDKMNRNAKEITGVRKGSASSTLRGDEFSDLEFDDDDDDDEEENGDVFHDALPSLEENLPDKVQSRTGVTEASGGHRRSSSDELTMVDDESDDIAICEDVRLVLSPNSGISSPNSVVDAEKSGKSRSGIERHWRRLRRKSLTKFHLREKMKDALKDIKTVFTPTSRNEALWVDEDDELGEARRQLGYFYAGKVLIQLSFTDLR